jgi:hypothetical protein
MLAGDLEIECSPWTEKLHLKLTGLFGLYLALQQFVLFGSDPNGLPGLNSA